MVWAMRHSHVSGVQVSCRDGFADRPGALKVTLHEWLTILGPRSDNEICK